MRDLARVAVAALASFGAPPVLAAAQQHIVLRSDVLLYGDNTEFRNPFREGETLLGAAARVGVDVRLNERVTLSLGVLGNERFGSDRAFELVRPVISLAAHGRRSTFIFGTLPARRLDSPAGPDHMGPHGLIPALQRETLSFDRPYEAGLQWTFAGGRLRHELWLEWQRINTEQHRERLDAGINAELSAGSRVVFPVQTHIVHEGGQLFASGAVTDSLAAAAGARIQTSRARSNRASLEALGVVSHYVPDRAARSLSRDGVAFFGRAEAYHGGWRGHALFWRGRDFIKAEGDPNYLSVRRGGLYYTGVRDYAETGISRTFRLAVGASFEVSGRIHRVEQYYEYSYRVVGIVSLAARLR